VTADVTRPDLPAVRVRPARSRSAIPPEAEATSQLAGLEALGALAVTKPLKVLDGELLVPPRGRHAASAPEESYRDLGLDARANADFRAKPPRSGGNPGRHRGDGDSGYAPDMALGEGHVKSLSQCDARQARITATARAVAVPERIFKPQERIPSEHGRGGPPVRTGGDQCHNVAGDSHPARLAPWQKSLGGAIPRAQLMEGRFAGLFTLFLLGVVLWAFRQYTDIAHSGESLAIEWAFLSLTIVAAVALSWAEQPMRITARRQARLDELLVTVNVPVYNEDPAALRLVIHSLLGRTRLPDRIQFVDDGSDKYDYAEVRTELY